MGNRLVFQGFEWKSGALSNQKYRYYHADLLVNLMPSLAMGNTECRWDIIPFVGVGVIDNRDADCNPFAFNYGVQGRFRIADCLHITAEIGNAITFKDTDGLGPTDYIHGGDDGQVSRFGGGLNPATILQDEYVAVCIISHILLRLLRLSQQRYARQTGMIPIGFLEWIRMEKEKLQLKLFR